MIEGKPPQQRGHVPPREGGSKREGGQEVKGKAKGNMSRVKRPGRAKEILTLGLHVSSYDAQPTWRELYFWQPPSPRWRMCGMNVFTHLLS